MKKCFNCRRSLPTKNQTIERMRKTTKSWIVCPCGNIYRLNELE